MRNTLTNPEYLECAAKDSAGNARHWMRYLRKVIKEDALPSKDVVASLLQSDALTSFQKISLKHACIPGSPIYNYILDLNRPYVPAHNRKDYLERIAHAG